MASNSNIRRRQSEPMKDPDPWVNLLAVRDAHWEALRAIEPVDGELPDELADPHHSGLGEIDALIASSLPSSSRGLRAAVRSYLCELRGGCALRESVVEALLIAMESHLAEENGRLHRKREPLRLVQPGSVKRERQ